MVWLGAAPWGLMMILPAKTRETQFSDEGWHDA